MTAFADCRRPHVHVFFFEDAFLHICSFPRPFAEFAGKNNGCLLILLVFVPQLGSSLSGSPQSCSAVGVEARFELYACSLNFSLFAFSTDDAWHSSCVEDLTVTATFMPIVLHQKRTVIYLVW